MSSEEEEKRVSIEKIKREHGEEPKRSEDESERTEDEPGSHEPNESERDKE